MSNITIQVGTASGNVCVGAYQGNGSAGTASKPATLYQSSGSVACPAAGAATIALGGSCTPNLTDWLALSGDNVTATFELAAGVGTVLANGFGYAQGTAFPLPSTVGAVTGTTARTFYMRGS